MVSRNSIIALLVGASVNAQFSSSGSCFTESGTSSVFPVPTTTILFTTTTIIDETTVLTPSTTSTPDVSTTVTTTTQTQTEVAWVTTSATFTRTTTAGFTPINSPTAVKRNGKSCHKKSKAYGDHEFPAWASKSASIYETNGYSKPTSSWVFRGQKYSTSSLSLASPSSAIRHGYGDPTAPGSSTSSVPSSRSYAFGSYSRLSSSWSKYEHTSSTSYSSSPPISSDLGSSSSSILGPSSSTLTSSSSPTSSSVSTAYPTAVTCESSVTQTSTITATSTAPTVTVVAPTPITMSEAIATATVTVTSTTGSTSTYYQACEPTNIALGSWLIRRFPTTDVFDIASEYDCCALCIETGCAGSTYTRTGENAGRCNMINVDPSQGQVCDQASPAIGSYRLDAEQMWAMSNGECGRWFRTGG